MFLFKSNCAFDDNLMNMNMMKMKMEKSLKWMEDRRASERTVCCMEFESHVPTFDMHFENEQLDPMDNNVENESIGMCVCYLNGN